MFAAGFFNDLASAWERSQDTFWTQTLVFLSLTLRALGLALVVGIPAGMLLTRLPRVATPAIAALAVLQTVPSLVLLGLLMPLLGIGPSSALFAAAVYSVFPVVLNTYVGITEVAPAVRDAARGMGMTDSQILRTVELPLAFPIILAGVRAGAVYASAMVVIGALIGAGGLGDYIYNGMSRADFGLIGLGTIPVLILTLLLFWGLGGVEWLSRKNNILGMWVGGALIVSLSLYAIYGVAQRAIQPRRADIVIGAKDFTEGQILAEILKQTVEAGTDLRVEVIQNLGTSVVLQSLKSGKIDLYPEYTGVLLTSKDGLDLPVPKDKSTITGLVRDEMLRRYGLVLLEPFGLNNTYAPSVAQETASRYNLKKISDLQRVPQLRVVIDLSFLTRPDGWHGMVKKYDLHFDKPPSQVSPNLLYKALEQKEADVVIGFATDWQIQALNLVALEDDRDYFPSYHAAPFVRGDVLERYPKLERALDKLAGLIDDETMRALNYQVAVEKRSEAQVAREFLRRKGIVNADTRGQ
jgi:osmoprotectant transport system permease protein